MDNTLVVSHNGEHVLRKEIGRYFDLKEESIGPPKIYLGGHMRQVTLDNGKEAWAFGSLQYVQLNVHNVEQYLKKRGLVLPERQCQSSMATNQRLTYLKNLMLKKQPMFNP